MRPKIGIMTMVFGRALAQGELDDFALLQALDDAGFDSVEVPSDHLLGHEGLEACYRAYISDSRLDVCAVDAGCNFVSREPEERRAAGDALRRGMDLAARLEAPLVLAAGSRLTDGITPEEGRAMIIEGLHECLPHAKALGVRLAIENFGVAPRLQCAAADCAALLEAVPGLAFVFDTGNFHFCQEDPMANVDGLEGFTRHVHLKDWRPGGGAGPDEWAGVRLGEGVVPNEMLVRRLRNRPEIACFSLECGAPGDRIAAARADRATLEAWLA